jgi:hypothetical protein
MSRISEGLNPPEGKAAAALLKLAEALQDCCYYSEQPIPEETRRAMHKAYRVLKPSVITYYGAGNHPLCWDPPDTRFKPKEKK